MRNRLKKRRRLLDLAFSFRTFRREEQLAVVIALLVMALGLVMLLATGFRFMNLGSKIFHVYGWIIAVVALPLVVGSYVLGVRTARRRSGRCSEMHDEGDAGNAGSP